MSRQLKKQIRNLFKKTSSEQMSDTARPAELPKEQHTDERAYRSVVGEDEIEVLRFTDPDTGSINDVVVLPEWALD